MCYSEGTYDEVIHIDRSTDMSCICYNTSYSGSMKPQTRTIQELDKQKIAEQKIIKVAKEMMKDIDNKRG